MSLDLPTPASCYGSASPTRHMVSEDQLQRLREAAYLAGRQAWPAIRCDQALFDAWAIRQAIDARALGSHGRDLFLAWACAASSPEAIAAFDSAFVQAVHPTIGRMPLPPEMLDELRQTLRVRLLTGPSPKIGHYKGSGPLGAWVRVTAMRIALELKEASERRTACDSAVMDALVAAEASPELAAAKVQHRDLFRAELERCFRDLARRDKTLLRLHFLHGVSIDQMGTILHVHRATVARWLVALRRQIVKQLGARLALEIPSGSAINSLIRLVWDDIELSMDRLLESERFGSRDAPGGAERTLGSAASPEPPPAPADPPGNRKSVQQRKPIE